MDHETTQGTEEPETPFRPAALFRSPEFRFHRRLALLAAIAFLWFSYITWTQYESNRIFLADAGIIDFVCGCLRHGQSMRYPLEWKANVSYMAFHFRPILYLISLLYFVYDNAMTLLTFFNAGLVLAVIPLCLFARKVLRNDWLALLIGLMYLTNHFLRSIHLAVHPEAVLPLGLFCIFLAAEKRWTWLYIAGFLWCVSIKEDIPLYLGAYGLTLLIEKDPYKRKLGLATIPAAIAMFVFAHLTMKWFGEGFIDSHSTNPFSRFAAFGSTKTDVAFYLLQHPIQIAGTIIRPLLFLVYLSAGLVALLDWRAAWIVAAAAGLFMMTGDPLVGELHYYYSYAAVPFLFYSTVRGGAVLQRWIEKVSPHADGILYGLFGIVIAISIPLRTRTDDYAHLPFTVLPHHQRIDVLTQFIPPDASVCAQFDLYAKVPNRSVKLPIRLEYLPLVDYVFIDLNPLAKPADFYDPARHPEYRRIMEILGSPEFRTVMEDDGAVLLQRVKPADLARYSLPADEPVGSENDSPVVDELDEK